MPAFFKAQILLPTAETAFEPQHHFNPTLIKQNGIKKITCEIIDKKDFEVAVDKSLTEVYEFNNSGFITRHFYTTIVKSIEKHVTKYSRKGHTFQDVTKEYEYDTIGTTFIYNGNSLILKRFHNGGNYYESRYYRYDNEGLLTKEMRFKETNNSIDKAYFVLGNQVLLSEDSFQYQKFGSKQLKCVYLNNENRPYKEQVINYDSVGLKKSIDENYVAAAWIMQQQRFEHKNGKLISATFQGNANGSFNLRNVYQYDENGELYAEFQYKNEILQKEISFITEKTTGLLNSYIIRDPDAKSLRIVKLKYDYGALGKTE